MKVAIVGAAGVCGRQFLFQILAEHLLRGAEELQLVGHRGGDSESTLWGLRADAADSFDESAPRMEIVLDAGDVDADIVVMMAGATVPTDPGASIDRAALAQRNRELFSEYAEALGRRTDPPVVIVQSNPVELAVSLFSSHLPRHNVLGAAAFSDSLRFCREVAKDLGTRRRDIRTAMAGQHGDHMVPLWSQLAVHGVPPKALDKYVRWVRGDRDLADLPTEIREGKLRMLDLVRRGEVRAAYEYVNSLPPDTRSAVKPFFIHFTAGRTTEATTAHAAAKILQAMLTGWPFTITAQVRLEGDWCGIQGVTGAPVILSRSGWTMPVAMDLAEDELALLQRAVAAADDPG